MPSPQNPSVAVVGAAGFVGRELLRRLQTLDMRATAIVRGLPELSVDGDFHACSSEPAGLAGEGFDVVVNLAYPSGGPRYEQADQNAAIARTVAGLLKDGGRLIQVSTLAVFGGALDRPIVVGPVSKVRDTTYVESKIAAEQMFVRQQEERGLLLDIVRLGNVWGYASGTWALPVVQRLLTGRPVGVGGTPGYSNATDVKNTADYLAFLIGAQHGDSGVRYHHMAEFSSVTWSEWIEPIAQAMGVTPVYADPSALAMPASWRQELAETFAPLRPRSVYRKLSAERITGSWTRTVVRNLPMPARARLQSSSLVFAAGPELDRAEQSFLAIMAGEREFAPSVDRAWSPVLSKEQSLERVLLWLERG
jgi:nucleoside-diphosphate-sugar epimerase